MITDPEWTTISQKAFPSRTVKAPPFLWTRILAAIETEEIRRASLWWMQWRWMSRVAVAVGLLVSLGTFYALRPLASPLDSALEGRSNQHVALQIASNDMDAPEASVDLVIGADS